MENSITTAISMVNPSSSSRLAPELENSHWKITAVITLASSATYTDWRMSGSLS
ncbi:hypothetical protein D3C76_1438170 [compost metagenome]